LSCTDTEQLDSNSIQFVPNLADIDQFVVEPLFSEAGPKLCCHAGEGQASNEANIIADTACHERSRKTHRATAQVCDGKSRHASFVSPKAMPRYHTDDEAGDSAIMANQIKRRRGHSQRPALMSSQEKYVETTRFFVSPCLSL
jgi:hypothetical protein